MPDYTGNYMKSFFVLLAALSCFEFAFANNDFEASQAAFPRGPEASMTPGSLCGHPDEYRYPEHIPYCKRDVDTSLKKEIIKKYDEEFGYRIGKMDRKKFKIDHYIPLCAGGSNEIDNLWPQHESVFTITDSLEQTVCEKMAAGKLKQEEAVEIVKKAKNDLKTVEGVVSKLRAM
jgi:hypothetical protein